MTSINGFCNEEFELEKEFCQKKMHVSVIKVHEAKMDATSLKTPWKLFEVWNFLAGSIVAYK